jgi:hypothetical protein
VLHCFAAAIEREYLATFAQEMHQVAPISTSSVENAHTGGDVSAKDLIEDVDVDLAELFLNIQRHT